MKISPYKRNDQSKKKRQILTNNNKNVQADQHHLQYVKQHQREDFSKLHTNFHQNFPERRVVNIEQHFSSTQFTTLTVETYKVHVFLSKAIVCVNRSAPPPVDKSATLYKVGRQHSTLTTKNLSQNAFQRTTGLASIGGFRSPAVYGNQLIKIK
jgi:hypothetical protein